MDGVRLLLGSVMHERLRPVRRRFHYPVMAVRVDLTRVAGMHGPLFGVDRLRPLSIRTRDHGPRDGSDLASWMRALLVHAGLPSDGAIWLQAFPRVFGWAFRPVSLWYCHDADGELRALLAEVTNTFGERHAYLLARSDGAAIGPGDRLPCRKVLHVSPFCRVEGHYEFRVRDTGDTAFAAIDYFDAEGILIRTAIGGRLRAATNRALAGSLLRFPLLPLSVLGRIHWQALLLLLAGVPWFRKPPAPSQALTGAVREAVHP